jgi:hypothetical protein
MFDGFKSAFTFDSPNPVPSSVEPQASAHPDLRLLLSELGGQSFNSGLYRTVAAHEQRDWQDRIELAFPATRGRAICFGYDWLGRAFALDSQRVEDGRPLILMLEPGTGEMLEIPANIETFHNEELVEFSDAALAVDFQGRWLTAGGAVPRRDQCVGYRKPLFLGGVDDVDNLETSDIDVYWHLLGQILSKVSS